MGEPKRWALLPKQPDIIDMEDSVQLGYGRVTVHVPNPAWAALLVREHNALFAAHEALQAEVETLREVAGAFKEGADGVYRLTTEILAIRADNATLREENATAIRESNLAKRGHIEATQREAVLRAELERLRTAAQAVVDADARHEQRGTVANAAKMGDAIDALAATLDKREGKGEGDV